MTEKRLNYVILTLIFLQGLFLMNAATVFIVPSKHYRSYPESGYASWKTSSMVGIARFNGGGETYEEAIEESKKRTSNYVLFSFLLFVLSWAAYTFQKKGIKIVLLFLSLISSLLVILQLA